MLPSCSCPPMHHGSSGDTNRKAIKLGKRSKAVSFELLFLTAAPNETYSKKQSEAGPFDLDPFDLL